MFDYLFELQKLFDQVLISYHKAEIDSEDSNYDSRFDEVTYICTSFDNVDVVDLDNYMNSHLKDLSYEEDYDYGFGGVDITAIEEPSIKNARSGNFALIAINVTSEIIEDENFFPDKGKGVTTFNTMMENKKLNEGFRKIVSKSVPDSDGFMTDYTMYQDTDDEDHPIYSASCSLGLVSKCR